jgi:hypothetical protein
MARRRTVIDAEFVVLDDPSGTYSGFNAAPHFAAAPSTTDVPLLSDAQKALLRAKMLAIIEALETARQRAYTVAYYWPTVNWATMIAGATVPGVLGLALAFATPADVKESVLGVLRGPMKQQIEIGRANMEEVLAGKLSFEKWFTARRYTMEGIAEVLRSLREDTVAANLAKTIQDVWNDVASGVQWVAQRVQELPKALPSTTVLVYAGLLLGAFILYQYATAPLRLLPAGSSSSGRGRGMVEQYVNRVKGQVKRRLKKSLDEG